MSLAGGDLTTLAAVKGYIDSPPADTVIAGLVTRVSRTILSVLNRAALFPKTYTEQYDGTGTAQLVLPHWPMIGSALGSLAISGVPVPIAAQANQFAAVPGYGYRVQPWNGLPPGDVAVVELVGTRFWFGRQNIVVQYDAGYQVSGEIPNETPWTPLQPYGSWATDEGVTYASTGVSLAPQPQNTTPSAGQYVPPAPDAASPTTQYVFASADISAGLLIDYGFIPGDIEQAAIELITERASYRKRISVRSQSVGGQEVMSYDLAGMTKFIQISLAPYISVVLPAIGAAV